MAKPQPEIGGTQPVVLELEPGTYWWCTCGRSKNQPWCDSSHKGTPFSPLKWEVSQRKRYALCTCKRTQKPPLCDGSHKHL